MDIHGHGHGGDDTTRSTVGRAPVARSSEARRPRHGGVHDLVALADDLAATAATSSAARAARTLVAVGGLRVTVIALAPGSELAEHDNPGAATLQVLRGRCRLVSGHDCHQLSAGDAVQIPDQRHSLETDDGCVVVLTVALGGGAPDAGHTSDLGVRRSAASATLAGTTI